MLRVLVTGASGFIGSTLCQRFLRDGAQVRALVRSRARSQALAGWGAELVLGDVQLPDTLLVAAHGCDVVFHVAAAMSNGSAAAQYNTNVIGTLNVMQAALTAGVQRYLHVSTVAVYGYGVDGPVDEDSPHQPSTADFYMQTKSTGEMSAWAFSRKHGLPMVAIRPAFVYGPGSSVWSRALYELCKQYPVPWFDGGLGHAHPVFVEDVVDLLVTAASQPDAPGYAFNAAPDPAPTWREYLSHYARMTGNNRHIAIPTGPLYPAGWLATQISRLIGRPVDLPGMLRLLTSHATYKMTLAADVLGWRPQISLAEGMTRSEPWLKSV